MMEILRFYKEDKKKWYADIPSWTGKKSSLQMISGADDLLDMIGNGEDEVYLHFSENQIEGSDILFFKKKSWINGATYNLEFYKGERMKMKVWLCDVTLHVFGYFPKEIYFKKVEYK